MQAVLDPKIGSRVDGVVVTSPAVGVQPSHPILRVRTSNFFNNYLCYFRTENNVKALLIK